MPAAAVAATVAVGGGRNTLSKRFVKRVWHIVVSQGFTSAILTVQNALLQFLVNMVSQEDQVT